MAEQKHKCKVQEVESTILCFELLTGIELHSVEAHAFPKRVP
jgi:hypothetical protein